MLAGKNQRRYNAHSNVGEQPDEDRNCSSTQSQNMRQQLDANYQRGRCVPFGARRIKHMSQTPEGASARGAEERDTHDSEPIYV